MSVTSLLSNPWLLCCALIALIGLILVGTLRRQHPQTLHTAAREAALEQADDGLIVVDLAGRMVEHNLAAARLAALDSASLGRPVAAATIDNALAAVLDSILASHSERSERIIALQDPQPRRLRITLTPLADASSKRLGALLTLRNLPEQSDDEAPAYQSADLTALRQIAATTGSAQDWHEQLRAMAIGARNTLRMNHAWVGLIDQAREQLTIVVESGAETGENLIGMAIPISAEACPELYQVDTPVTIADPQNDQRLAAMHEILRRRGARSLLIVPLRNSDGLIGTLNLISTTPRQFEPKQLALAQTIAGYMAAAIANRQLYEAAQQADRAKSAILDAVSHEFRTPITAILGFTELYQESVLGPVTEEQLEALDAVHRNAHRLLKLVDDLLDLARLEAGKLDISLYPVEVGLCIKDAVGLLAPQFQQKQLELRLEIADELPLAWADSMWLRRVLTNLLTNSLRYAGSGMLTVRAFEAAQPSEANDTRRLLIEIEDAGRAIPEAEQELIFNAFQRTASVAATMPASSGAELGLTISKRAVDQMEGQLTLHSQPGLGSIFTITLHTAELALEHP
jgi:signal transduction histidine kinase